MVLVAMFYSCVFESGRLAVAWVDFFEFGIDDVVTGTGGATSAARFWWWPSGATSGDLSESYYP
jgi:hypothetical protein